MQANGITCIGCRKPAVHPWTDGHGCRIFYCCACHLARGGKPDAITEPGTVCVCKGPVPEPPQIQKEVLEILKLEVTKKEALFLATQPRCSHCGHMQYLHDFDSWEGWRSCDLPGCDCEEYRKPE